MTEIHSLMEKIQISTDGEDTNIDWNLGTTYDLFKTERTYLQTHLSYLQKETHHNGGAYKAFNLHLRAGYDLKLVLPYIGATAEFPLFQHKFADNNPKYDLMGGLYKNFKDIIAVDTTFHYNYDKLWKSKKLYATAIEYCKKIHINKVFLGTYDRMETAIHFYKNRGFNEVKALRQDEDARFFEMYI